MYERLCSQMRPLRTLVRCRVRTLPDATLSSSIQNSPRSSQRHLVVFSRPTVLSCCIMALGAWVSMCARLLRK